MVDASSAETGLRDYERIPLAAQQPFTGNPHTAETHVWMQHRALGRPFAEGDGGPQDLDAGRIGRDQKHAHSAHRIDAGVGDRHDDEEGGLVHVGGEELLTIEDPAVALTHCRAS